MFNLLSNLRFDEILGILISIGTFANIVLYIAGFVRRLENRLQAEASAQNTRLSKLEGQTDALINFSKQ